MAKFHLICKDKQSNYNAIASSSEKSFDVVMPSRPDNQMYAGRHTQQMSICMHDKMMDIPTKLYIKDIPYQTQKLGGTNTIELVSVMEQNSAFFPTMVSGSNITYIGVSDVESVSERALSANNTIQLLTSGVLKAQQNISVQANYLMMVSSADAEVHTYVFLFAVDANDATLSNYDNMTMSAIDFENK